MSVEPDEVPRRGNRREGKLERNLIEGPHMIELAAADASSTDPDRLLQFTHQFRELLSTEFKPPIGEDVKSDLVPRFVQFLGRDDVPQLQSEAAWVLGEIASGTPNNSLLITDLGAVPTFVKLLGSARSEVREEAVQALVKISCAYSKCLDDGLPQPPHQTFLKEVAPTVLRRVPFDFSSFVNGSRLKRRAALMVIKGLLKSKDDGILANACYGLHFYLSRFTSRDLLTVIDAELCPAVVELLRHPSSSVHIPALYVVILMTWEGDALAQAVVDHGVLASLKWMLINTHEDGTEKAVCLAIANITARNNELIGAVAEEGLIPLLIGMAKSDEYGLKKRAIQAIADTTLHGSHENISRIMVRDGGMKALCDMLIGHGPRVSQICLDGLGRILKTGELEKALMGPSVGVNEYAGIIADIGGLKKIREIKNWPPISGIKFRKKAAKILTYYWGEEVEKEALAGNAPLSWREHPASRGASDYEVDAH